MCPKLYAAGSILGCATAMLATGACVHCIGRLFAALMVGMAHERPNGDPLE